MRELHPAKKVPQHALTPLSIAPARSCLVGTFRGSAATWSASSLWSCYPSVAWPFVIRVVAWELRSAHLANGSYAARASFLS